MSKEFIENKIGNRFLVDARRQQKQLAYFTQSSVQEDITEAYIDAFVDRNYSGEDAFINWVKTIFRTDNFLSFFKYLRSPVASARLVNDRIKPQLSRVFFSEDSFFKYVIDGESVEEPEEIHSKEFNDLMFNAILFRYNDILIADLSDVNTPFRDIISIDNVVAIESKHSEIIRIAYKAKFPIVNAAGNSNIVEGFIFMDSENYILYNAKIEAIQIIPHDLGVCPADYISRDPFGNDDIVRKSIFSYVRESMEEYVFLKTLQRMQEPNGAIPIVTKLKTKTETNSDVNAKKSSDSAPMLAQEIGGQNPEFNKQTQGKAGVLQAGSIVDVPIIKKDDGSIDMEIVKNFLNFFYIPVEALKYLNDRVSEIEEDIVMTILGDLADQTNERKNEIQVKGGFVSAEDRIRSLSLQLSRIRTRSDYKIMSLKLGPGRVFNEAFYGSDFFLESQKDLYDLFDKSPNPIERKNILLRLSKNRNKFNKDNSRREEIAYHLIPYVSDEDFEKAIEQSAVDPITFQLQTRFNYWMGLFEASFGDILVFWRTLEGSTSAKIIAINNLLKEIIKSDEEVKKLLSQPILAEPTTT